MVLGTIGPFSGPVGALFKDSAGVVSVWAKWINGRGGANGHPVRHIVADDAGDPARHRSLVREMVDKHKIHAFVFLNEGLAGMDRPDPYIVERRIPVLGTSQTLDYDYDSPFYFPQGTSGEGFNVAAYFGAGGEIVLAQGKNHLGTVTCVEAEPCRQADGLWRERAKEFGFDLVYQSRVSLAQPDFTAVCLAARNAGADVVFVGLDTQSMSRLAGACARQGYTPQYVLPSHMGLPELLTNPNLEGTIVGTVTFAWPTADSADRREFQTVLQQYFQGKPVTGALAQAWTAAKLFEEATKDLPEPPTSEAILQGGWKIRNNDLGGLTHPLSFFPDRGADRKTCWGLVAIKGGRYTAPRGGDLKCLA